ncbi:MalY/PatB family protein [Bacillus solitudinis]|uniref:MalY/PatB family protein n=1 Tax=Bacillus solitudinis TaxID=2014074 RepID=UPI000C23B5FD|nr:MalY/PatB family protein [Bacillus solitudinis]
MSKLFEQVIERRGTASMKWDMLKERFGAEDLWPMWVADMDFRAPQAVLDALKEKVDHGIFGYPAHSKSVDEAVQNWLARRYQWKVNSSAFIYTPGVVPTLSNIIKAFTEKQDEVVIQTPVYYPFYDVIKKNERDLVRNPLVFDGKQYKMDLEHLESVITDKTKMIILCHPHNPGGRVWTREELELLAAVCKRHDLLVISDEIHADLLYEGHVHVPLASINDDMANRTFTCLAPSKTFNLAGIQTSYVVVENDELRTKLKNFLASTFMNSTNSFAEVATEAAYRYGEEWLDELMSYVQKNYDMVSEFLKENMPKIRPIEPEGTYLLWLDCSELGLSAAERKNWLIKDAQVALNHGPMFGEEGKEFERMNLACPSSILKEGLNRMKVAYERQGF